MNDIIKVNNEILTTEIDDEIGMMNIKHGLYYTLNPVGKNIWSYLSNGIVVEDLINKLVDEYDVSKRTCSLDVLELIKLLKDNGLIEIDK